MMFFTPGLPSAFFLLFLLISVIVMDNASFHKRLDIQHAISKAGHRIEYLPPYLPALNPIEHKWEQAKSKRRDLNCSLDALFSQYST